MWKLASPIHEGTHKEVSPQRDKLSCPWQKCSDSFRECLRDLHSLRWGYGPTGSCCYCAAGCTSKVIHLALCDSYLPHFLQSIHFIGSCPHLNFWSVNLDPFLSTLKIEASCCFKCQGQLTVLKGGIMRATTWMAWKFENTLLMFCTLMLSVCKIVF